jgi:acetoin utilization protein AcuB
MDVTTLLRTDYKPCFPSDTVATALLALERHEVRFLPIVENGKFLGLIGEATLLEAEDDNMPISRLQMKWLPGKINGHQHLLDAFGIFSTLRVGVLAVVDDNDLYLGCIDARELVWEIGKLPSMRTAGGIVILEMAATDYHLSQIGQILESDDARILGLLVNDVPADYKRISVTIKTNKTDLTRVLQTFKRYDYEVVAVYHKGGLELDLRDRYEALMRFLDM